MTVIFLFTSCQSSDLEPTENKKEEEAIKGVKQFKSSLAKLSNEVNSRSIDEEPSCKDIELLIEISKNFLGENEISIEELGINDEEMLPVLAMAILDYQKTLIDAPASRTTAGGCVLEALGVKEVINATGKGIAKKVAKAAAKAVLKRAVPYVGWGLFIYDYITCVVE